MATTYSSQLTAVRAGRKILPYDDYADKSVFWSYVVPTGGEAIANLIVLAQLPKDARLKGGREAHSALSSGAGVATVALGLYAQSGPDGTDLGAVVSASLLQAAVTYDAAGQNEIGITEATGLYYLTLVPLLLVATVSVEALAAAGTLKGHLNYTTAH